MRRLLVPLIAAVTLVSTAYVQVYRDEFNGGFSLGWRWTLLHNDPFCTLFDNAVSFGSSSLTISTRDGGMFQQFNSHKNVPTLRVVGPVPQNWYIETVFRTDWSTERIPVFYYTQAGLVILPNAKRYFQVLITRDAFGQTATVYGSTNAEGTPATQNDDEFRWGERVTNTWSPDNNWMGVRIEHVPGETPYIRVQFRNSQTNGWVDYNGFNGAVYVRDGYGGDLYNHIISLLNTEGVRIGIYTDNACGCGLQVPFEFDYFETNIPVPPLGDVNEDGCVNNDDLLTVLFEFGASGDCLQADVNSDGVVNNDDLLVVLFNFGVGC